MGDAIAKGYVQRIDDLRITYREMPNDTARFALTLPNGELATLGRNWNYVVDVEPGKRR